MPYFALALPVMAFVLHPGFRSMGYHLQMHAAIVYGVMHQGFSVENPLFAGRALSYSYGWHMMVAALSRLTGLDPISLFAVFDVLNMAAYVLLLYLLAGAFSSNSLIRWLSVFLAAYGSSPFVYGPLRTLFGRLLDTQIESRIVPLVKFTSASGSQFALVAFAMALLGYVLFLRGRRRPWAAALVAGGLLIAGAFYPFGWAAAGLAGMIALAILSMMKGPRSPDVLMLLACLSLGFVWGFGWTLATTEVGQSGGNASFMFFGYMRRHVVSAALALAMPGLLIGLGWRSIYNRLLDPALLLMLLSVLLLAGVYMAISLPFGNEYKFMMFAQVPLAMVAAQAVKGLTLRPRIIAGLVAVAAAIPFAARLAELGRVGWPVSDRIVSRGTDLGVADPAQDALLGWIREDAPATTVVIDSWLLVPAIGQRALFVGLDLRPKHLPHMKDGWLLTARALLRRQFAIDTSRREELASRLLDGAPPTPALLTAIAGEVPGRPVVVVARDPAIRNALARSGLLRPVLANPAGAIFRLDASGIPDPGGAGHGLAHP